MKKFLLAILLVLVVGVGISFYFYQRNTFSKEVLKLEILGPEKAQMGQEVEFLVKYKNQGNITLEDPKLFFEYPSSSIHQGSQRITKDLPDIYPGQENSLKFKAKLLGQKGDTLESEAGLSFRPKNLKARFESQTSFISEINSVPLTFEMDLPSRVEKQKKFSFRINYFLSADYSLSGLGVKMDYPLDFNFSSSEPSALDQTQWEIKSLAGAQGGRIEIEGSLEGDPGDQKAFRAQLGLWKEGRFIPLKKADRKVKIIRPNLHLSYLINDSPAPTVSPGEPLNYEIFFTNIGEEPFQDLFLVARLKSELWDWEKIKTEKGDLQKQEEFLIWDWKQVPALDNLEPGEQGKVEFEGQLKPKLDSPLNNPELSVEVSLDKLQQVFVTKVNSRMELKQKVLFEEEQFGNQGPLPPRVGEETTYSVVWKAKNFYNELNNVKVKATLPDQVRLTGDIKPQDAKLTFDSESREIVWDVGKLGPANPKPDSEKTEQTGQQQPIKSEKSVAFQIELEPDSEQRGQTPVLINQAQIIGEDTWTEDTIRAKAPSVNTTLPDDPTVTEEQGIVKWRFKNIKI